MKEQIDIELIEKELMIYLLICNILMILVFILTVAFTIYTIFIPLITVGVCGISWGMVCLNSEPNYIKSFYVTAASASYMFILSILLFKINRSAGTAFEKVNYKKTNQFIITFVSILSVSILIYFVISDYYFIFPFQ